MWDNSDVPSAKYGFLNISLLWRSTIVVIIQHMRDIILAITGNAVLLLVYMYLLLGLPLSMTLRPVSAGVNYAQSSALLFLVILITGPALYCVILIFPVCYLKEVYQLNFSLLEFLLVSYLVFFVTSILINIMTEVLLRVLIRPLWSCWSQQRMMKWLLVTITMSTEHLITFYN